MDSAISSFATKEDNLGGDFIFRTENKPETGSNLLLIILVNRKTGYVCSPQEKSLKSCQN